jgi:hypothetical protein
MAPAGHWRHPRAAFVFAVLQQVVKAEQAAAQGVVQNPVVIIETQLSSAATS